jgi:ADP-heptose:LPS heptosyltransferase
LGRDLLNRIEENLRLAEMLAPRQPMSHIPLYVPDDVQEEIEGYFESTFDGGKCVVAMHVAVERAEKAWPAEHFAALADLLLGDGRFEVVLTWGPGQRSTAETVAAQCRRNVLVAPAMETLKHYIAFVQCADMYFGADTGPMHIAAAMGTPVVAVFGGTNPIQHAPVGLPCEILAVDSDTRGGSRRDGAERLRRITPEAAYDACVRLMSRPT